MPWIQTNSEAELELDDLRLLFNKGNTRYVLKTIMSSENEDEKVNTSGNGKTYK